MGRINLEWFLLCFCIGLNNAVKARWAEMQQTYVAEVLESDSEGAAGDEYVTTPY